MLIYCKKADKKTRYLFTYIQKIVRSKNVCNNFYITITLAQFNNLNCAV